MIVIIDYGVGNLFSLKSSLLSIGENADSSSDFSVIDKADGIILPGVGAFSDAADKLIKSGLSDILIKKAHEGVPLLGICLGMQLLFDKSYEYGEHSGLKLLRGEVRPIPNENGKLKIPHIGWNSLKLTRPSRLFKYINEGDYVYFVHSYYATGCEDHVIAQTEYGTDLTAAVADGNIFGCQFHPEKSGEVGLRILKAFCEMCKEKK